LSLFETISALGFFYTAYEGSYIFRNAKRKNLIWESYGTIPRLFHMIFPSVYSHWEKSWENFGKILYVSQKFPFFSQNGRITISGKCCMFPNFFGGNIQNFPEIFSRFPPVHRKEKIYMLGTQKGGPGNYIMLGMQIIQKIWF